MIAQNTNEPKSIQPWLDSDPLSARSFLKDSDEISVGHSGGKQSKIKAWPTELPASALLDVAEIMQQGAKKYGCKNWWAISVKSELDHAMNHVLQCLAYDDLDRAQGGSLRYTDKMREELGHAAARILMALDQYTRTPELGVSE